MEFNSKNKNIKPNIENQENKEESEEEELNLITVSEKKTTIIKQVGPAANENYKKLNPLSAAHYKNPNLPQENNVNRSKTKSPFKYTSREANEKSDLSVGKNLSKSKTNNTKNPNLLPLSFGDNNANMNSDLMSKTPGKYKLYEKIFQRAQQIDNEEKIKHEEVNDFSFFFKK